MSELKTEAIDPTDAIFGMSAESQVLHFPISSGPHFLIAGTTGSGKSVFLNQLLITQMCHSTPKEIQFEIVDPKKVEFQAYVGNPYMLIDPITDMNKATEQIENLVKEMEDRYSVIAASGTKKISEYNEVNKGHKLPYIELLVDEYADLHEQIPEIEKPLIRLAQKGRAAGIHLILATQSPRATVITGLLKANFPSRVSLKVASSIESDIILDQTGAENLNKHGDMFIKLDGGDLLRAQSGFIKNDEIDRIQKYLRENYSKLSTSSKLANTNNFPQEKKAQETKPNQNDLLKALNKK